MHHDYEIDKYLNKNFSKLFYEFEIKDSFTCYAKLYVKVPSIAVDRIHKELMFKFSKNIRFEVKGIEYEWKT